MHAEAASPLAAEHGSWLHFLYALGVPRWVDEAVLDCWLLILVIAALTYLATRRLTLLPKSAQNLLELVVEQLEGFTVQTMGPEGRTFAPFIGTLFLYIFLMNVFGLIPGFLSPTANLNTTVALALCVMVSTQYHGIRTKGLWGYLKHLWGEPRFLGPLMLLIHLIEEFVARPLSLAIRLFGNIFGEDTVIAQLGGMVVLTALVGVFSFLSLGLFTFGIQVLIIVFALFTGFVQALIFATLAAVYVAGAIEEH